jgi:hypothetical protein
MRCNNNYLLLLFIIIINLFQEFGLRLGLGLVQFTLVTPHIDSMKRTLIKLYLFIYLFIHLFNY